MDLKKVIKNYVEDGTTTLYDFQDIIEYTVNKKVLPIPFDSSTFKNINKIALKCKRDFEASVKGLKKRENEIGNWFEKYFISELEKNLQIKNIVSGGSGYPDGGFNIKNKTWYVEVKTFNTKSKTSTMRSFYTQPSSRYKVKYDGYHVLVAFEKSTNNNQVLDVHMLDLSTLKLKLKMEFNASNKDMYLIKGDSNEK